MRNVNEMNSNARYAQGSSLQAGESLQWGWCIISHVCKLACLFVLFLLFLGSSDSFLSKKDNKSCCNSQWNSQQRKSQHQSRNEDFGLCEYSAIQAYESYLNMRNVTITVSAVKNYCAGGLSFTHGFLQAWLLLCASLMITYSASALCLFLSVIFDLLVKFFKPTQLFGEEGMEYN
ncbi:hypothetical protein Nmel_015857 [Mimus melanotis]